MRGVIRKNGNGPLREDRPAIVLLIDVMHGCTGHRRAGAEDGAMHAFTVHPGAAERRQERRMNVEDATRELRDEVLRQEAEKSREGDEVDSMLAQQTESVASAR